MLFSYTLRFRYTALLISIHFCAGSLSMPKGTIYINYKEIYEKWKTLYPHICVSSSYFHKCKPAWITKGKIEECCFSVVFFVFIFQVLAVPVNWENKGPVF